MAKKGVKVKELARELGIPSRAIISRCRGAGHPVQNSITRLPPDLERTVRAWFRAPTDSAPGPGDPPAD